jgi:hypothetical protein
LGVLGGDNYEFRLDVCVVELRRTLVVAMNVKQRRGGLTAVDNLQVGDGRNRGSRQPDAGCGRRDAVVVGEKPVGLSHQGVSDPAVHLAPVTQIRADVAFEKTAAVATVEIRQQSRGDHAQVRRGLAVGG